MAAHRATAFAASLGVVAARARSGLRAVGSHQRMAVPPQRAAFSATATVSAPGDIARVAGPRFSSTVVHSRVVYLAGQVAKQSATGTVTEQAIEILATIDGLLRDAGTDKARILSANVYLRDIGRDFDEFNTVWDKWLDRSNMPVRATVGAGLVGDNYSVEIQVTATLPDRSGPVKTGLAAAAVGPYNQGVVTKDGTLYASGCIGLLPGSGEMAGPDIAAQARQALSNLSGIVKAAGGSVGNIVKTTVLLADINDYAEFNEIYKDFFKDVAAYPARSAFAVSALPKNALVEVEAIAELP